MQRNLAKNLEQLGLTPKESLVYLALLENGKSSIAGISLKTGIKRPTCYLTIDELVKRGLVSSMPIGRKTLYSAEHPTQLVKNLENTLGLAKNIVSGLQDIMTKSTDRPMLRIFNGQKGIQQMFEKMLAVGKDFYYIASVEDMVASVGVEFLDDFIKRRIAKGITSNSIRMESTEIIKELYDNSPSNLRHVRYAPESFNTPYTILIFGDFVSFVSRQDASFGFIVESKDLAKTMKSMFDVVWSVSVEKDFYKAAVVKK